MADNSNLSSAKRAKNWASPSPSSTNTTPSSSWFDSDLGTDEQSKRYKSAWQDYLRTHHHTEKIEPIDCFLPLATNLSNGLINDCTSLGHKTYVRMLIRHKRPTKVATSSSSYSRTF